VDYNKISQRTERTNFAHGVGVVQASLELAISRWQGFNWLRQSELIRTPHNSKMNTETISLWFTFTWPSGAAKASRNAGNG
jgi:hypothetical protein